MPSHEVHNCPRCTKPFVCKVGDIAHCQCSNVQLTAEELEFIGRQFGGCLCVNCMLDMKHIFHEERLNKQRQYILRNR